jgi:hypothetical protein
MTVEVPPLLGLENGSKAYSTPWMLIHSLDLDFALAESDQN